MCDDSGVQSSSDMRKVALSYVLAATLQLLSIPTFGEERMIEGLVFNPVKGSGQDISGWNCPAPFSLSQEPDPYFQDMRKSRVDGAVRFERAGKVLENFPDELTLHLVFLPNSHFCTVAVPQFDPEKIKFKAVWRNGSQILPAEGAFFLSERPEPRIWCEDHCGGSWVYELRIESAGVPLTGQLEITVEAENGNRVAQFTGKLGPQDPQNVLDPVLDSNRIPPTRELAKP